MYKFFVIAFYSVAVIGYAGEWVTRESDNAHVCRLSRNLYSMEPLRAHGWCGDWQEYAPQEGQAIDSRVSQWIRCFPIPEGCKLHFSNGWRP